jgi:hypothetical protein
MREENENENARTKRVVFSLNDARPRKNVSARARDCGDVVVLFFFFAKEVEICVYILCDVGWG